MSLYNIFLLTFILLFSIFQSIYDFQTQKIPLWLQALSIAAVFTIHVIFNYKQCWIYLIGAIVFGAVYWLAWKISKGKLGIGDIIFGIFQGGSLRITALPICLLVEAISGIFVFLLYKSFGKTDKKLPFIPFMSLGLLAGFIFSFAI